MPTLEGLLALGLTQSNAQYIVDNYGSTSTSSTSGTASTPATTEDSAAPALQSAPLFTSLGTASPLASADFAALRTAPDTTLLSATPTEATAGAYSTLFDPADLAAQLTVGGPNGGAVFATLTDDTTNRTNNFSQFTIADVDTNGFGQYGGFAIQADTVNPFGFVVSDGVEDRFVQIIRTPTSVVLETAEDSFGGPVSAAERAEFEATARADYDAFEAFVATQASSFTDAFSPQSEVLLGLDQNANGAIDNESELIGFDNGVALANDPLLEGTSGTSLVDALTGGNPDALLALNPDGSSTTVQSSTGFVEFQASTGARTYVSLASVLSEGGAGAADITLNVSVLA